MHNFLSEQTIAAHKEYVCTLRLKYSILADAIGIKNAAISEILSMNLSQKDKTEALLLLGEIKCHDMYFASFCENTSLRSNLARRQFGSEDAFAMCVLYEGLKNDIKFVSAGIKQGRISIHSSFDYYTHFEVHTPRLMIDTAEHAYFWDYGFDKERYLKSALSYLNLTLLDEKL